MPVSRLLNSETGTNYPKIIDYACGAGHFLTEAIEAINFFANSPDNDWTREYIYGIEKDYRLARVAKISLFMNGAGEGNIIFSDGLENDSDKGIANNSFDILVANPPYSVKDFKRHLQLKNNSFTLLDRIGNGGEIEVLFVERIAQLLRPQGIAAVILPSSILSNDSASYIGAREQLLQNFYIRAIVALGSKTFGATGTNTVIMFLEKFNEPPKQIELSADSVDAIFSGANLSEWDDKDIFERYAAHIEVSNDTYKAFLNSALSLTELEKIEYFNMYVSAFADSNKAKTLVKKKAYKKLSDKEQKAVYLSEFYLWAFAIEREKMLYFSVIYKQRVLIITAPADNAKQKIFLGYDWSNRKGNEGIVIHIPGGMMYDDADRLAENTLSALIRNAFNGTESSLPSHKEYYKYADLKDMLDFSRIEFNKAIRTSNIKSAERTSKYDLKEIGSIAYIKGGDTFPTTYQGETNPNNIPFYKVGDMNTSGNEKWMITANNYVERNTLTNIIKATIFKKYTTIFPKVGMAILTNKKRILLSESAIDNNTMAVWSKNETILLPLYLYEYIAECIDLTDYASTSNPPSISATNFSKVKIPVPPLEIQRKIVDECTAIDEEYNTICTTIGEYRTKIEKLFNDLETLGGETVRLDRTDLFNLGIGKRVLKKQILESGIPIYSANVYEPFGCIDDLFFEDCSVGTVIWGIDGDWDVNYIPPNTQFFPTDHCGTLRVITETINERYLAFALKAEGKRQRFTRSNRASTDRVKALRLTLPSKEKQDAFIAEVSKLETEIETMQIKLADLKPKKQDILTNYLT